MKRTLVLVRHAKSDWGTMGQTDFERPLNDRGKRDAPEMGKRLMQKGIKPDLIIASNANRAATTAKLIAKEVGYSQEQIVWIDKLYHCPNYLFDEVISEYCLPYENAATVLVVAHNPGITLYANEVQNSLRIDNMPTCGMLAFSFNLDSWSLYASCNKQFLFFDFPKNK